MLIKSLPLILVLPWFVGFVMLPYTIGGSLIALLIGRLWSHRRKRGDSVASGAPRQAELLLAFVVPLALMTWAVSNYGRYEAQRDTLLPEVVLWVAVGLEFIVVTWLAGRHWCARRTLAIATLFAAAHFTGGAWITAGMALWNVWM